MTLPIPPRRRWSFSLRMMFVVVGLLGIVMGACEAAKSVITPSMGGTVSAQFEAMPVDDSELEAWLRDQPGVVARTVHVKRVGKTKLVVGFIQSRNLKGNPPLPNLNGECKELGYVGADFSFVVD